MTLWMLLVADNLATFHGRCEATTMALVFLRVMDFPTTSESVQGSCGRQWTLAHRLSDLPSRRCCKSDVQQVFIRWPNLNRGPTL